MYKVVGWRKEYYRKCEREFRERQERLRNFEHDYEASLKPDRRTKAGKELAKKWKEVLAGDFGLIFHPYPTPPSSFVDWEGFDPENLEGFEKVEVKV